MSLMLMYLRPRWARLGLLLFVLCCGIVLQLGAPQLIGQFIDAAQRGDPAPALIVPALLFVAIALGQQVANFGALYFGERLGWDATNQLRADLMRHLLSLDLDAHKATTPGALIERLTGDVDALGNTLAGFTLRLFGNGLLMLGIIVVVGLQSWLVAAGLALYAVLTVIILLRIQPWAIRGWAQASAERAGVYGYLEEHLTALEDIRAAGAGRYVLDTFGKRLDTWYHAEIRASVTDVSAHASTQALELIGYALGLAAGAWLYLSGNATIGGAFVVVYYFGMFNAPLEAIRNEAQDFQQAGAALSRVSELFSVQPTIRDQPSATLPSGALGVQFDDVRFAYAPVGAGAGAEGQRGRGAGGQDHGEGNPVPAPKARSEASDQNNSLSSTGHELQPIRVEFPSPGERASGTQSGGEGDRGEGNSGESTPAPSPTPFTLQLSLKLPPGRVLGVLGRTGSGKTTLGRLLARLYEPQHGTICLGDVPISNVALAELRRRVGVVTQDVQLFPASVRENVRLFDATIDDGRIHAVLAELELTAWLDQLPNGLDTPIGPGGIGLSAGQAQLLAFARVLLRDPGLVILDEASARLDPATEQLLERAVDRLLHNRSAIIIAHRLSTISRADDILIMANGAIIEHGERRALAADPQSHFAALLRAGLEEVLA